MGSARRLRVGSRLTAHKIDQIRQTFLDALPIAGAIVELRQDMVVRISSNALFETANRLGPLLDAGVLGQPVRDFLLSDDQNRQFGWQESDSSGVTGPRQYSVRLGRLLPGQISDRRCLISLIDRTAEVDTAVSLHYEMVNDSLTGLLNRTGFAEEISRLTASADEGGFAVLVVDLDRFGRINVCMGASAGDELIISVARRLSSALRADDRLARIGGDEFAILLRLIDGPGDALHVAKRIEDVLTAPFRLSDFEIRIDCAIGCAISTEVEEDDEQDLVRYAQFALRRAKTSGRPEVYQNLAFTEARRHFTLETELRRAIEGGRLHLAFQPIIDLSNDRVAGFEALARWNDESGTEIKPVDFIPVAEESGLIVPLGRWALDAAARTLADWDRQSERVLPLSMNVNLSAIQLARDNVPRMLEDVMMRHRLAGDRFTLELTESAVVKDPDRAARVMESLKALDARMAMDDFGTGYSNLALLQRLPVDMLKIDRSFVTTMLADRDKVAIVRAVLGLATALGMSTTAEGIETIELSQTLTALGCTFGQGYYYAQPLDTASALAYWQARRG